MTPKALAALHAKALAHGTAWSAAAWADFGSIPSEFLLTEPGGFVAGRVIAGEAEMLVLVVDPANQRAGLGRRLLTRFENEALRRQAHTAILEVAEPNTPARAFYEATGFAEVGRRPGYAPQPDGTRAVALIMQKALTAP